MPTRRSSRWTVARTCRSRSATRWRSGPWSGRSASSNRPGRSRSGTCSAEGGAAALVTHDRPAAEPGRLLELTVTDLALIDRVRLTLDAGLNVITGETGAGKSLLIDALGLALGARADTTLVRHGADVARVEALFDRLPEPLIVAREISTAGRSTARLDDTTVTAARLADEVGALVEVHGQHDQGRLLEERWQRDLLDGFGGHDGLREAVAGAVARWRDNRSLLDAAALDPRDVARRLDLLEHEAAEIVAARLRPGEADEISGRLTAAQHGRSDRPGIGHAARCPDRRGRRCPGCHRDRAARGPRPRPARPAIRAACRPPRRAGSGARGHRGRGATARRRHRPRPACPGRSR